MSSRVLLLLAVVVGMAACHTTGSHESALAPAARPVSEQPVVNDNQKRARAHVELGTAYLSAARFGVALEEVRIALKYDPNYAPAHYLLGLVHMYLDEKQAAQKAFETALRLAPGDPEFSNTYGWFLCVNGQEKEGLARLAQAAQNPYYSTPTRAYTNSGLCYLRLKDEAAATAQFGRALALDPKNDTALFQLAHLAFMKGDLVQARQLVSQLNQMVTPTAESLWLGLRIERKLGNHDAEESYAAQLRRAFTSSQEYQNLLKGQYE